MKNLMLPLLALLLPVGAGAQPKPGMLKENGVWKNPTPEAALHAIMTLKTGGTRAAEAILRQEFEIRPPAELDAFAAELARIMVNGTNAESASAKMALIFAAKDFESGTPYAGAVDVFIRIYESFENRTHRRAAAALRGVFKTGGEDYVRNLFNSSEQPPPCTQCGSFVDCSEVENPCPNVCTWCVAGDILRHTDDGPDYKVWSDLCARKRY